MKWDRQKYENICVYKFESHLFMCNFDMCV